MTASPPSLFSRPVRRLHCVGVGGMGLAPLALYLVQLGFVVTGEDDALTADVRILLVQGRVGLGPLPADCELVVYSSAIAKSHPACVAAAARGLPLVRRGELLAEVVRDKKLVAICGSHGKTTTTAMLIAALRRANFPAGHLLGGLPADGLPPAGAGANEWVVAEIDESDGTIGRFSPEITVAVNLDWDHPDHYRSPADLEAAFQALFDRTRGTVLLNAACAVSARFAAERAAASSGGRPVFLTFGRPGDFSATPVTEDGGRQTLALGGLFALREAVVRARGDFNALNAAAALAAAQLMGAALSPPLLADFPGVRRRQTVLHEAAGVTVIEDYAHHPAEIRALLASLRRRSEGGRLVVAFQPHRFSRTAQFKAEFAAALALADSVHLLAVYPAGEAPVAGGTTAEIAAELRRLAPALPVCFPSEAEERARPEQGARGKEPGTDGAEATGTGGEEAGGDFFPGLSRDVRRGDVVVFVGAGDIDRKARTWVERFKQDSANPKRWDNFVAVLRPMLSPATKLTREEPLAKKTTLRVGGAARLYAEPAGIGDLQGLLREAARRGIAVYLLGRGSNLIIPDEGVEGLVISLANQAWSAFEPRGEGRVWVGAGLRLKNLCGLAAKSRFTGFEFLEGIPGTVGGALRMNAGAMGGWMFDVVEEVQLMTFAGQMKTLPKPAMHVDYRQCAELQNAVALGALLRPAAHAGADEIGRQIDVYRQKRHETQPREPSAGCIFKNPPGHSAGRLIDESGLKGERVGGAEVSTVHANFIVNRGTATGADVLELVRRVRARVHEATGVELQPEVLLYGKTWGEVL
jgi:UDP-N-acetylenolpyruvoylglucosamine reductase